MSWYMYLDLDLWNDRNSLVVGGGVNIDQNNTIDDLS